MKIIKYNNEADWLKGRIGRITGSKLKDIVVSMNILKDDIVSALEKQGTEFKKTAKKEELEKLLLPVTLKALEEKAQNEAKRKIGSYQLIADRLGIPADEEKPIDRGHRLEKEAIAEFVKMTGKKVDDSLVMWTRDENDNIAYSPDGSVIGEEATVEIKCLGSARHIEALITNEIPSEFEFQKLQSFIVNDKQETLYFCFYDPRLIAKPFIFFTVTRAEVAEAIETYRAYQENELNWVNEWVNKLSDF